MMYIFCSCCCFLSSFSDFLFLSLSLTYVAFLTLSLSLFHLVFLIKMNRKGESFDGLWQQNDSPEANVVSTSIDRKPKHVCQLLLLLRQIFLCLFLRMNFAGKMFERKRQNVCQFHLAECV